MEILQESPEAPRSLELLESGGMPRRVLLSFLHDYTDPQSVRRGRVKRAWAAELAKRLMKTSNLMQDTAERLEGADGVFNLWDTAFQAYDEAGVVETLKSAVERLKLLQQHYHRISTQRGKARDEESLVYLCLKVDAITGRRNWENLAYLLEVAFEAQGHSEDWNEDALRKIVARFKRSHPKVYDSMKDFIISTVQQRPQPASVTRSTRNRRFSERKPSEPVTALLHGLAHRVSDTIPLSKRPLSPLGPPRPRARSRRGAIEGPHMQL
jgi:hypothetical protein